ncbi:MAG: MFS transporter [Chitinophagaceae bacterium]|nr:MFS transporter [Chitinophagaceae bacterium]
MSDEESTGRKVFPIINKEFTLFLAGRILFIAGLRMTPVLLGWKLYEITGSKFALGMLGLSEVIPAMLLALPAGVRIDRSNKRKLISTCMAIYFFLMLMLLFATSSYALTKFDNNTITWIIFGLVGCTGAVRAYNSPAMNAFVAQLVPQRSLVRAVSVNSMAWLSAAVAGPALGGLLLGYTNITVSFIVVCSFIAVGYIAFRFIKSKPISWNAVNTKKWDGMKEGLQFVFSQKALLGAMSLDMFAVLFGGAIALLPVFAKDVLAVGPQGLGWLIAASYMGNFVAIAVLTYKPLKKRQGRLLFYMVGGFGLCILVFALSQNYVLSFIALFASGLFDGVSVIIRGTILQLIVPDNMRGRVSSVNSIFINSSNELGQFESGVAASMLGTVPSVIFGGCMTLLVTGITWLKSPGLRKFEY